jgi:hypothetical protein
MMAQLASFDQFRLDQAREALAASKADTDAAAYPRHLGSLEVCLKNMIRLVEQLAGNGNSGGKPQWIWHAL